MIELVLLIATALSLVWLPWPITIACMLAASVRVPLAGIIFGVLLDVFYAPFGAVHLPIGICVGALASLAGYGISRFLEARIMGA